MKVIIAEKPSLGRTIATAISKSQNTNALNNKGYITVGDYIVTYAYGHLLTLWDPEDYDPNLKEWKMETIPFYFPDWKHKAQPDKADRVKQIGALLQHADTVVNAGDIDEEGQLLIDEIIEYDVMNIYKKVKRNSEYNVV